VQEKERVRKSEREREREGERECGNCCDHGTSGKVSKADRRRRERESGKATDTQTFSVVHMCLRLSLSASCTHCSLSSLSTHTQHTLLTQHTFFVPRSSPPHCTADPSSSSSLQAGVSQSSECASGSRCLPSPRPSTLLPSTLPPDRPCQSPSRNSPTFSAAVDPTPPSSLVQASPQTRPSPTTEGRMAHTPSIPTTSLSSIKNSPLPTQQGTGTGHDLFLDSRPL